MMKTYEYYRDKLKGLVYPYACLDMELLDANIDTILSRAGDKTIRIASKSIRCVDVMRYIFEKSQVFQGVMTYHGAEALYLSQLGFDDILMGYPVVEEAYIKGFADEVKRGKQLVLMVDSKQHVDIIAQVARAYDVEMPVCIDVDMSVDFPGLHFGVWRSSIQSIDELRTLLDYISTKPMINVVGMMGYEAQIAGVTDNERGNNAKNWIKRLLKQKSVGKIQNRRSDAVELFSSYGYQSSIVNGGGTGSMETTCAEACVTEVTVGSGFYNSHLFDNYQQFQLQPALFYGIPVVREPKAGVYTCHEGGYIASGATESIKAPVVHLPKGGKLDPMEGAGEVQTPIRFADPDISLSLGDPVYLRHAKAGELCERFDKLYFLRGDEVVGHSTYRGDGKNFG